MVSKFQIDENNCLVAYQGNGKVVKVPEGVVSIGKKAFESNYDLKEVTLPKSCTVIEDSAFQYCSSLKALIVNGPLTKIGDYALLGCENLETFTVPETLTEVGKEAITIDKLKDLHIPKSIVSAGYDSFTHRSGANSLTEITVDEDSPLFSSKDGVLYNKDKTVLLVYPGKKSTEHLVIADTVQVIEKNAFIENGNIKSVTLPNGIREIKKNAFYGCKNLEKINFPEGLVSIGFGAFNWDNNLKDIGAFPSTLKVIERYAFFDCKCIKEINIPGGIETVGYDAFGQCHGLERVILEEGVKKIDFLKWIINLKALHIPSTVTEITGLGSIEYITVAEDNPVFSSEDGVLYNKDKTELIKYAGDESRTTFIAPSSVKTVSKGAFRLNKTLEKIILPKGVERIEEQAFANTEKLITTELPSTLKFLGKSAFHSCDALEYIDIPKDTEIELEISDTFYGAKNIRGDHFHSCKSLKRVTLPNTIKHIAGFMFSDCENLTEIKLPESVETIESWAFGFCGALKEIEIPSNCKMIGEKCFTCCANLEKIVIPPSVEKIEDNALSSVKNLTIYGEKGSYAEKYAKLENIPFIPILTGEEKVVDGFLIQGDALLEYVGGDTDIVIPKEVKSISASAFAKVKPRRVTIHKEVKEISPTAFGDYRGFTIIGEERYGYIYYYACNQSIMFLTEDEARKIDAGAPEFEIENGVLESYNGESLNITIPDEVNMIYGNAFKRYDIESLTFGKNVKRIFGDAAPSKAKIAKIYYNGKYNDAKKALGVLSFFESHGIDIYVRNEKGEYEKTLDKDTKMFTTRGMDASLIFDRLSVGEETLEKHLKELAKKNKGKFKTRFSFENSKQGFIFECPYKDFDKGILEKLVKNRIPMVFDDMVIYFPFYNYSLVNRMWGDNYGECSVVKRQKIENGILSVRKESGSEQQVDKVPASTKKIEPSYFDNVSGWRVDYSAPLTKWLKIEGHEDIAKYIENGIVLCYDAVVRYLNIEHGKLPKGGGYWGGCHLGFESRLKFEEASHKRKYWETVYYLQVSAVDSNYMRHEVAYYGENGEDDVYRSIFDYDVFCDTCVDLEGG